MAAFCFMRGFLIWMGLAGLFLGWNAPNHYPPWTSFHLEFFAAIGVAALAVAFIYKPLPAWALRSYRRAVSERKVTWRVLPLPVPARLTAVVAALPLVQYLAGIFPFRGDALLGFLYGLGMALSLYVGLLWAAQQGRERVLHLLWITIVVSGLAAAGLALLQWLHFDPPGWWAMELIDDRPFANLAQANHLGLLMVMAVIAVTALFETHAVRSPAVHALAVAFFGWAALMSQSRASVLALLTVALCWLFTRRRVPTRLRLPTVAGLAIAGLLAYVAIEPLQHLLFLDTAITGADDRGIAQIGPRKGIWLHFWAAINQRPWVGYGFNQGVMAMAAAADQVQPSRNVIYAHNVLLDAMTWFGIPLALLMAGAVVAYGLLGMKKIPDANLLVQRHAVFAIWLALVLQSMVEYPYAHAYFLLPAALLAGAVMDLPAPLDKPIVYRASAATMLLTLVTLLLLAGMGRDYFRIESDFRFARFEHAKFARMPDQAFLSDPLVLDQLAELTASSRYLIAPGMSSEQLRSLQRLARRFHILSTRLDYAHALALNGRLEEAAAELRVIRSVYHPRDYQRIKREWLQWLDANQAAIDVSARNAGSTAMP